MPFISKDWRDPGKLWIKTDSGWEEKLIVDQTGLLPGSYNESDESLLEAMQDALVAASKREAMATELLEQSVHHQCSSESEDSGIESSPPLVDYKFELMRAKQKRTYYEWELSKRNSLINEEPMETQCSMDDVKTAEDLRNTPTDESPGPSHNKPENFIFLKIKVRERIQVIERKAKIRDISEDVKQENDTEVSGEDSVVSKASAVSNIEDKLPDVRSSQERVEKDFCLSDAKLLTLNPPPHCHITVKNTREISGFNRLCEVLKKLDFKGAVWDQRRFNYICKLLELLTTKKLRTLTGGSQKMLIVLLEEVANSVRCSQQNIHVLRHLVSQLQERLCHCIFLGKQLGSSPLWQENTNRLHLIQAIATTISVTPVGDQGHPNLQDLPEECIRAVLLRLTNHNDLQHAGEAYSVMGRIIEEQRIWRQLCKFHWSEQQIKYTVQVYPYLQQKPTDWKKIYTRLKRCHGLKEEYAVSLVLCKACHCLFWESLGHPCLLEQDPSWMEKIRANHKDHSDIFVTIPPHTFLSFFS